MNAYERVIKRLRGEPVDRPPNFDIMMQFAAHYIGQPLSAYYQDYRVLCDANFAVQQDFSLDILQAISDPYRETHDWGAEIGFPEDGLPICENPPLAEDSNFHRLHPPVQPGRRMTDRLEAIRLFRQRAGGEVPVMGWVEGALAEAADLRGVSNLMLDFYDRPDWLEELLEKCTEVEIAFARAQIEAGADIIGLGDAIASQISPALYEQYALPYEQRIFAAVHEMGALARLHICGNTTKILPKMALSGADIIDIDWMVDMAAAATTFGNTAVCGNFDPLAVMLRGTPEQVRQATAHCMELGGARSFSAAGCEIPDGTPHENLLAQAGMLREISLHQS
ncbi:MAG: uroporphyrinogen decarboxylase family protein [Chloroflexi bacterium]|nr:uroporphyrinogen decarboxylase family protein [Chloroflexota bacterium]